MSSATLYFLPQVIQLSTDASLDGNGGLMNYPMNATDINLLSSVQNSIQFFIRDIDRHVVNVAVGSVPYLQIYDDTGYVLFDGALTLLSASQGLWQVIITRSSLPDWETKSVKYAVFILDQYGVRYPLFTDRGRGISGVCKIIDGPVPPPRQPMIINAADFILRDGVLYSGAYAGAATVGNQSGQGTASYYCTEFMGTIQIEGSLDLNISTDDSQWFNVDTHIITIPQSGPIGKSFTGNFTYVRFVVNAASGSVDKIIYTV